MPDPDAPSPLEYIDHHRAALKLLHTDIDAAHVHAILYVGQQLEDVSALMCQFLGIQVPPADEP